MELTVDKYVKINSSFDESHYIEIDLEKYVNRKGKPISKEKAVKQFYKDYETLVGDIKHSNAKGYAHHKVINFNDYFPFTNLVISLNDFTSICTTNEDPYKNSERFTEEETPVNKEDTPLVNIESLVKECYSYRETVCRQIVENDTVEKFTELCKKLLTYFNKSNLEISIKAGAKQTTTRKTRKKATTPPTVKEEVSTEDK